MTYNDLCDNGCPHPRYKPRRVCKLCVAAEMRARRLEARGGIPAAPRGRPPKQEAIKRQRNRREDGAIAEAKFRQEYNELMGRMARVSLRVSA